MEEIRQEQQVIWKKEIKEIWEFRQKRNRDENYEEN